MHSSASPEVVVGIDVAKDHLDVHLWPAHVALVFENSPEGINALVARLQPYAVRLVVIEAELHRIERFPKVGQFVSYCRLVRCAHESNQKKTPAKASKKIGNAHLRWAFGEAACLMLREVPEAKRYVARLERKHGKAKALSILSARLARTVYWMLKRKEAFDAQRFLK
jgi:transposase